MRRTRHWLAAGTVLASLITALDMIGLPLGPVRAATGTVFALVVPGSAVLLAVRPAVLPALGRVVLTIPLSLAVLALVGVTLDHSPLGIGAGSLIAGSAATVGALLGVAWWRERSMTPVADGADPSLDSETHWRSRTSRRRSDGAVRQARAWMARARQHLREPLFLHAYALGVSGVLTSGLGVVYWAVAARLYPPAVVGVNAALLSLVTLLASVAQLNLRSGFGRFAPLAGPRTWRLIGGGYAAALAIAVVASIVLVRVLAVAPGILPEVQLTPTLAWLFPATVVLWTLFVLQDYVLTSLRRTVWVPIENAIFAIAKIGALLLFVAPFPLYGILVSWTVPTFIGVVVVSIWLVRSVIPAHVRTSRDTSSSLVTLGSVTRYVGVDYVASLFAITSTSILPSVVLAISGAPASAHFYIVTLVASAGQLLPAVLTTSLLVEASASEATFERDGRRVLGQMLLLLVPLVIILVIGAPFILGIFGAPYAADGTDALRLYALAALPYALVQLAFVRLRVQQQVWAIVIAQAGMAVALVAGSVATLPALGITGIGAVLLAAEAVAAIVLSWTVLWPALRGGRHNVSWVSQSPRWRPTRRWNATAGSRHRHERPPRDRIGRAPRNASR